MLQTIVPPSCVGCIDLHYTNHNEEMDEYTMEVLEALEKAKNVYLRLEALFKSKRLE